MRISEYIRELEDFKKQNGDLEMLIGGRDGGEDGDDELYDMEDCLMEVRTIHSVRMLTRDGGIVVHGFWPFVVGSDGGAVKRETGMARPMLVVTDPSGCGSRTKIFGDYDLDIDQGDGLE